MTQRSANRANASTFCERPWREDPCESNNGCGVSQRSSSSSGSSGAHCALCAIAGSLCDHTCPQSRIRWRSSGKLCHFSQMGNRTSCSRVVQKCLLLDARPNVSRCCLSIEMLRAHSFARFQKNM
jgi:hypothetical protein